MRPRAGRALLCLAAMLLGAGLVHPVAAAELELALGAAGSQGVSAAMAGWTAWLGETRPLKGEWQWRSEVAVLGVGGHREGWRRHPDVALAGAGVRVERNRLFAGFALAVGHDTTPQLSSHHQFVSTLGWRFGNASLVYRHISNASTRGPNRGEDMVALTLRFKLSSEH